MPIDELLTQLRRARNVDHKQYQHLHLDPTSELLLLSREQHPVFLRLSRFIKTCPVGVNHEREDAVMSRGRSFLKIARPRAFGVRPVGFCFKNSMSLAVKGRGTYVEGFAIVAGEDVATHHAWITPDNVHAIDVTWRYTATAFYFGIPFDVREVSWAMAKRNAFQPMLDPSWNWGAGPPGERF